MTLLQVELMMLHLRLKLLSGRLPVALSKPIDVGFWLKNLKQPMSITAYRRKFNSRGVGTYLS